MQLVGDDLCPIVWKAIGDELVFCGRVSNKRAVCTTLAAFIETIHSYRKTLNDHKIDLNLKGAAWLAAFPEPNRAVQVGHRGNSAGAISASEALERAADQQPFNYDFLGKAIDTGFRVASTATPERFSLCVQLSRLLASLPAGFGFDFDIRVEQPMVLKGVNRGIPYPVLYIDTMEHLPIEAVRKKERALLKINTPPSREELSEYLNAYCGVVGTDEIFLPTDINDKILSVPTSYETNRGLIAAHLKPEAGREPELNEPEVGAEYAEEEGGTLDSEQGLEPLVNEPIVNEKAGRSERRPRSANERDRPQ